MINLKGKLCTLQTPMVMGILNCTPDSFYENSRCLIEQTIADRATQIISQGGDIIDVGGYSSRPNAAFVSEDEELRRLAFALNIVRRNYPHAVISVDTFRSEVARRCVEEFEVSIINDISSGALDKQMFDTVAQLQVPYIAMHMRGTPQTMMHDTHYDNLVPDIITYFATLIDQLHIRGVNDVIVDPGFGFSKTLEQNYQLMQQLDQFALLDAPLLVGVSRKSMIYKLLNITPQDSLTGTTALHTYALLHGAKILRVHDVVDAVSVRTVVQQLLS